VLLAMLTGGMLAGIIGAIAALPLVAAYPSLERLWLAPKLEPEVLKGHEDLRAA
jgi:predicted PurR-regulated permease PerM